jgi:hypothetical protein
MLLYYSIFFIHSCQSVFILGYYTCSKNLCNPPFSTFDPDSELQRVESGRKIFVTEKSRAKETIHHATSQIFLKSRALTKPRSWRAKFTPQTRSVSSSVTRQLSLQVLKHHSDFPKQESVSIPFLLWLLKHDSGLRVTA